MPEKRSYIKEATSREKVLGSVRNALMDALDFPGRSLDLDTPDFVLKDDDTAIAFAKTFVESGGHFVYCEDVDDFLRLFYLFVKDTIGRDTVVHEAALAELLTDARIPFIMSSDAPEYCLLSSCEALVANTGEILFSHAPLSDKLHTHAVIAYGSQLFIDRRTALKARQQSFGKMFPPLLRFLNGSSASQQTPDKEFLARYYVFFIDNKQV
jgi:L-lactate dehydrogenase complex protein LldG